MVVVVVVVVVVVREFAPSHLAQVPMFYLAEEAPYMVCCACSYEVYFHDTSESTYSYNPPHRTFCMDKADGIRREASDEELERSVKQIGGMDSWNLVTDYLQSEG